MSISIHAEIIQGRLPQGYELQQSDVGRRLSIEGGFGKVLGVDVGKRCYAYSYGFAMENDTQRDERKAKAEPAREAQPLSTDAEEEIHNLRRAVKRAQGLGSSVGAEGLFLLTGEELALLLAGAEAFLVLYDNPSDYAKSKEDE